MSASTQVEVPELTDAEVVRPAQQGDAAVFERIYRLHSRKLYSLCLRMVGDPAEAEGLTQDIFVQLCRKIGTYRGDEKAVSYSER